MGPTTYLYVPGNKLDFAEKAFNKGAENIFIDLEDSIPIQLKSAVRDSVCNFLKEGKPSNIYVRINSIDSFQEEDISALNKIKFKNIVIPKLEKNSAIIKKGEPDFWISSRMCNKLLSVDIFWSVINIIGFSSSHICLSWSVMKYGEL